MDSASLYLNRADGGWPTTTGITEPLQIEPLADGFVELGNEDVLVYSAYGSKILSLQVLRTARAGCGRHPLCGLQPRGQ